MIVIILDPTRHRHTMSSEAFPFLQRGRLSELAPSRRTPDAAAHIPLPASMGNLFSVMHQASVLGGFIASTVLTMKREMRYEEEMEKEIEWRRSKAACATCRSSFMSEGELLLFTSKLFIDGIICASAMHALMGRSIGGIVGAAALFVMDRYFVPAHPLCKCGTRK